MNPGKSACSLWHHRSLSRFHNIYFSFSFSSFFASSSFSVSFLFCLFWPSFLSLFFVFTLLYSFLFFTFDSLWKMHANHFLNYFRGKDLCPMSKIWYWENEERKTLIWSLLIYRTLLFSFLFLKSLNNSLFFQQSQKCKIDIFVAIFGNSRKTFYKHNCWSGQEKQTLFQSKCWHANCKDVNSLTLAC